MKRALRLWADDLLNHFDLMDSVQTRYLPAICRYALTATRKPQSSEAEERKIMQ
jgi:hypothetical protein